MNNNLSIEVSIPTDDYGYVLLKCSYCGTFFKATPDDIKDEGLLKLFCPSCGMNSENYITDEVLELAQAMIQNKVANIINDRLKKMEKQLKHGSLTFKAVKGRKNESENLITSGIETLELRSFPCCNRTAKIKLLLKITGCYCPFCGVKNYEDE